MENLLAEILLGALLSPFRAIMLFGGLALMLLPVLFLLEQARERSGRRRWGRIVTGDFIPARATFQACTIVAIVGFIGITYAFMGAASFRDSIAQVLFWPVILIGVVWIWGWVEKEFAWPGWLVATEVKDVPGEFFERRERSRKEKEELIELGREVLSRQAAEAASAVPEAAASQDPDPDPDLDPGSLGDGTDSRNGESGQGSDGRAHRG
jgi:hypothetical protein